MTYRKSNENVCMWKWTTAIAFMCIIVVDIENLQSSHCYHTCFDGKIFDKVLYYDKFFRQSRNISMNQSNFKWLKIYSSLELLSLVDNTFTFPFL